MPSCPKCGYGYFPDVEAPVCPKCGYNPYPKTDLSFVEEDAHDYS